MTTIPRQQPTLRHKDPWIGRDRLSVPVALAGGHGSGPAATRAAVWRTRVGVVAAASMLAAGCSSTGSTAVHGASGSPSTSTTTTTAPAAGSAATSATVAPAVGTGVEAPIGAVPWSKVGPGWVLATWSPAAGMRPGESPPPGEPTFATAATTLYLVDPAGTRYLITTFAPPGDQSSPKLTDWSGDGNRALLWTDGPERSTVTEVDLHSGAQSTFSVGVDRKAGVAVTPRYTRPEGKAVLLAGTASFTRIDLAGNLQLAYPVGPDFEGSYLSTPDGTHLVVGSDVNGSGLTLMGNDGTTAKVLLAGKTGCTASRWWDSASTIIVASCQDTSSGRRLWLVPIDGGAPTALTSAPNYKTSPDNGDIAAWQLPAGTYVQDLGPCGVVYLAKLNAVGGTTTPVAVPGVDSGQSVEVIGVNGGDLDLQANGGCGGGQSLIDYNPTANTATVLLGPPLNGGDVMRALPYPGQE